MIFWLNAQLPPSLAKWLTETFDVRTVTRQYMRLQDVQYFEIFNRIKSINLDD